MDSTTFAQRTESRRRTIEERGRVRSTSGADNIAERLYWMCRGYARRWGRGEEGVSEDLAHDLWINRVPVRGIPAFLWRQYRKRYQTHGGVDNTTISSLLASSTYNTLEAGGRRGRNDDPLHLLHLQDVWAMVQSVLGKRRWEVLRRWCEGETTEQIGRSLGVCQARVRQIRQEALEEVRRRLLRHLV